MLSSFRRPKRVREPQRLECPSEKELSRFKTKAKAPVKWVFRGRQSRPPPHTHTRVLVVLLSSSSGLGAWERTRRGGSWGAAVTGEGGGGAGGRLPSRGFLQLGLGALSSLFHSDS